MANKENYRVEWTEDGPAREVKIRLRRKEMVIQKGLGVKVYIGGGKVAVRKGRKVKGVELLKELVLGKIRLLPAEIPEETVVFTHNSPLCVNIPTRSGWVRW